jgi:hypothetical protein
MKFQAARTAGYAFALFAIIAAVSPVSAQSVFDGSYKSTAISGSAGRGTQNCATINSMTMTISGGRAVVREVQANGTIISYQGTVNSAGQVSATSQPQGYQSGTGSRALSVTGTIQGNTFTGQRMHDVCTSAITMMKG